MRSAFAARVAHRELSAILQVVLHAAICGLSVIHRIASFRLRTRRQRCQGESWTLPASGSHQNLAGVLSGRILRAELGAAARPARETAGASLATLDQSAAIFACPARDVRRCVRAGIVLLAERSGTGAGHWFSISRDVLGGAWARRIGAARHRAADRRRHHWI